MAKIDVINSKLIVPDDYQQFWVHFEWFLALFHISGEKKATVVVQAKSTPKMYFFESSR